MKDIIKSIFNNHEINKVTMIEENDSCTFIIHSMTNSIPLERWENLENLLKYVIKKEIYLCSYPQAITYFQKEFINKGVIINE